MEISGCHLIKTILFKIKNDKKWKQEFLSKT